MPKISSSAQPGAPDGGQDAGIPQDTGAAPSARPGQPGEPPGRRVAERRKQYLVAPRAPISGVTPFGAAQGAVQPPTLQTIEQALRAAPDIDVVRTVGPRNLDLMSLGTGGYGGVLVARMTDDKARALHEQAQGQVLVERDQHLALLGPVPRYATLAHSFTARTSPTLAFTLVVLGKDGAPLPDAEVSLLGGLLPASGLTDERGQATITVHGDSPHAISGVHVEPRADYWSFYQHDPDLSTDEPNVVALHELSDWPVLPGFPARSAIGWGERAMRLDQLPQGFRGQGVKIAVIDSGAATSHPNLNRIRNGYDVINNNRDTWNQDILSHGSHCTGVVGGSDPSFGIRGFAPEAEIHVCKMFPGGQISQLIDALEYCIEHQIDVVN